MRGIAQNSLRAVSLSLALMVAAPSVAQPSPLSVPAGEYKLDTTHASLTWKIMHLGLSHYTARFTSFNATVMLDPKDVTKSAVSVSIDPNSVETDFPFPEKEDFDKVIANKFLQSEKFPTIVFKSSSLAATGANTGKLTGDLTFMGVTKPVTLDVKLNGATVHPMLKVPVIGISATGTFKRSDFGNTVLQGPLGDEITLLIEAEFQKK